MQSAGFQRAITYSFQFWSELVINLLFMFIYLCVWRALYSGRASVGGYGREQLFSYIIVSQTLITFQFTVRAWAGIEAKVRTGEIVVDLVRPIDFQGMILATGCGTAAHTLLTNMLPKFALFALAGVVQRPASLLAGWLFPLKRRAGVPGAVRHRVPDRRAGVLAGRGARAVFHGDVGHRGAVLRLFSAAGVFSSLAGDYRPCPALCRPWSTLRRAIYAGSIAGGAVLPAVLGQMAWVIALLGAGRILFAVAHRRLVVQGG